MREPFTPRLLAAPEIKGWCPGALRPMQSGDGLLLRAKTIGPRLAADAAQEIAAISASCGNGLIDLSQRGQLQLRGVKETTLEAAIQRLGRLGLLARDAATESILNFIVSPLMGLGADALIDARDLLARLSHELAADRSLQALPGKFGFLIDDGSALGLAGVTTDIRLEAYEQNGTARVAVIAEGARDRAVLAPPERASETAIALAQAFLSLRRGREFELRRMRSLVEALGVDALAREAGVEMRPYRSTCQQATSSQIFGARLPVPPPLCKSDASDLRINAEVGNSRLRSGRGDPNDRHFAASSSCAESAPSPAKRGRVGEGAVDANRRYHFAGIGAPFGRWRAGDIAFLGALAAKDGVGELRLTPWRAILLPCKSEDAAREMAQAAGRRGLIVEASDARLAVVACPGAPECPQARGETRASAKRLAPFAKRLSSEGVSLHVAGCAKGCAAPRPAKVTLLARDAGFDLIDNGRAGDPPSLSGLSLDEIKDALIARMIPE